MTANDQITTVEKPVFTPSELIELGDIASDTLAGGGATVADAGAYS